MRLSRPSSVRARRRVLATGAVVAVGLLVAGCTADEPAEPDPTTTTAEAEPSETPEPSPTETGPAKPERPAAMEQEDAEGAAAAAEYFIELYPYVMTTGDTSEWEAMSHEACGPCASLIEDARLRLEDGDVFEGGGTDANMVQAYQRDEATGIFPLDLEVAQEAVQIASPAGEVLYSEDARTFVRRAEMGLRNGAWTVVTFAEVPA